jgi:hypothetical protein
MLWTIGRALALLWLALLTATCVGPGYYETEHLPSSEVGVPTPASGVPAPLEMTTPSSLSRVAYIQEGN